jgi:hypothetical protein
VFLPTLDENALSESAGLGAGAAGYGTKWWSQSAGSFVSKADATSNVDWNNSGGIDAGNVAIDVNKDNLPLISGGTVLVPAPSPLTGYDDWSHLDFKGGAIGAGISLPPPPQTPAPEEATLEVVQEVLGPPPEKVKAHAATGMITLTWAPAGPKRAGLSYNVFRHGDGEALFLGNTANSNFHDKTVVAGATYTYSVTIVDPDSGEGAPFEVEVTAK